MFVPPDDHEALSRELNRLIARRRIWLALALAARLARGRYGTERMAARYLNVYADLLDAPQTVPLHREVVDGPAGKLIFEPCGDPCASFISPTRWSPTGITAMPISCAASSRNSHRRGHEVGLSSRATAGACQNLIADQGADAAARLARGFPGLRSPATTLRPWISTGRSTAPIW